MIQYITGDWSSIGDIIHDFEAPPMYFANIDILLAYYDYSNYSGEAFVLYKNRNDGKLYEVNASHCSCFGLEKQWKPEETSVEALYYRMENGTFGVSHGPGFKKELISVLEYLNMLEQYPTYDSLLEEMVAFKQKYSKTEHQLSLAMNIANDALTALRHTEGTEYETLRNRYSHLLHGML